MIQVSPRNPRFLEDSAGRPYLAIGPNLCFVRYEKDPEKFLARYDRWTSKLQEVGADYFRIWLGWPLFNPEPEKCGVFSEEHARRIGAVLDLAHARGLKVKLTIDHFRFVDPEPVAEKFAGSAVFSRELYHRRNGGVAENMEDYLTGADGRRHFLSKLDFFKTHFSGHPAILAWELWNEMNAVRAKSWPQWTREMIPELKRRFPDKLALQSLGGFENPGHLDVYQDYFANSGSEYLQVHRYLNEKEGNFEECFGPVDIMAADAIRRLRPQIKDKPFYLAEVGAVEPGHAGPFRHYGKDKAGSIGHDIIFAPFFAGGSGPGQIWHWQDYLEPHDLWWHYARFRRAIEGLDPIQECFEPIDWQEVGLRVWGLLGKDTLLLWLRDIANDWRSELEQGIPPRILSDTEVSLPEAVQKWLGGRPLEVTAYDPWADKVQSLSAANPVSLPEFERSLVLRIRPTG